MPDVIHTKYQRSTDALSVATTGSGGKPNPSDVYAGHMVRNARGASGFSQTRFGAMIGVSFQRFRSTRRAQTEPPSARRRRSAPPWGCRPQKLFQTPAEPPFFSHNEVSLVRDYRRIGSEDNREALHRIVKTFTPPAKREEETQA